MSNKCNLSLAYKQFQWLLSKNTARNVCHVSCQSSITHKKIFSNKLIKRTGELQTVQNYAKAAGDKKGKHKKNVHIYEDELKEFFDLEKLKSDFNKPIEIFKKQLLEFATLRSSQGFIENFKFKFDGNLHTIQDFAEISRKNPKFYILDFSLFPQVIPVILSELRDSIHNINAQQDGNKVYVPLIKVTKEQREQVSKTAHGYFVKCRIAIRDIQIKYSKSLEKNKSLSEDLVKRLSGQLKTMGDQQVSGAEKILKDKQSELLNEL